MGKLSADATLGRSKADEDVTATVEKKLRRSTEFCAGATFLAASKPNPNALVAWERATAATNTFLMVGYKSSSKCGSTFVTRTYTHDTLTCACLSISVFRAHQFFC